MNGRPDLLADGGFKVDLTPDGGRFTGYASLFGVTDLTGDVVMPGAFRNTLEKRGAAEVKLLYQHDPSEPVGRWLEIREDARGLRVSGEIHAGIARGREVLSLIRSRILDGLSIGFRTVRARTDGKSGVRKVAEIDLWEISIVTFPMLPGARITGLGPDTGDDPEALARDLRKAARRIRTASR
ncbi:HK97 family phage prohead protease [Chthonobacter albigriseus]|uniref:HK97 family phage prohead protease n=1 Tax=Chthonobacter albigriseus TaxID=1683161 RepID=UPI0015EE6AE8|nr:HK97 family phage prohead protease [Chthonobacter albigriseus]